MHQIELLDNQSEVLSYNVPDMPVKLGSSSGRDSLIRTMVNHWHNDFEFIYISAGEMSYSVNGMPIRLSEGQMIFVNSARMHYNFWDEGENGDFVCTIFHPSMLDARAAGKHLDSIIGSSAPAYIVFRPEIRREKMMIDLVLKLHEAAKKLEEGYELRVMAYIYEISLALMEYMKASPDKAPQSNKKLESMHRMIGFVQQNYSEKISLADIAAAGFVSRTVCCEIFRKFADQSPVEYLTEYRISKSTDLLSSGDMSITEIAAACGFGGSSYFTETFRKIMGCTPSEFRQKIL